MLPEFSFFLLTGYLSLSLSTRDSSFESQVFQKYFFFTLGTHFCASSCTLFICTAHCFAFFLPIWVFNECVCCCARPFFRLKPCCWGRLFLECFCLVHFLFFFPSLLSVSSTFLLSSLFPPASVYFGLILHIGYVHHVTTAGSLRNQLPCDISIKQSINDRGLGLKQDGVIWAKAIDRSQLVAQSKSNQITTSTP